MNLKLKEKEMNEITNENLYLFSQNSKIINKILSIQDRYYKIVERNQKRNKEAFMNYKNFIKKVSELIPELSILNHSISYSISLTKFIQDGHASKDLKFTIEEEIEDKDGLLGLNVIDGKGCCRHVCVFFQDVFQELGMCGDIIPCINEDNITLEEAFSYLPNHTVNLIEYRGVYYVYDALNINFYKFTDQFTMNSYFDEKDFVYFKPSASMILNDETIVEVLEKLGKFLASSKSKNITNSEFEEILKETVNIYNKNLNLIKDFESDTAKLKRNIVSRL